MQINITIKSDEAAEIVKGPFSMTVELGDDGDWHIEQFYDGDYVQGLAFPDSGEELESICRKLAEVMPDAVDA